MNGSGFDHKLGGLRSEKWHLAEFAGFAGFADNVTGNRGAIASGGGLVWPAFFPKLMIFILIIPAQV